MFVLSKQDPENQFVLLGNQAHLNPLEACEEYLHVFQ